MKINKITFVFTMLLSMVGIKSNANFDYTTKVQVGKYYYYLDNSNDNAELAQSGGYAYVGDNDIPSNIEYNGKVYCVTSIGRGSFNSIMQPFSVNIPNTVTNIGDDAFGNSAGLTSINIPNNVITIGDYAFHHSNIVSITIPDNVTSFGKGVFKNCLKLSSVILGNGVMNISDDTFSYCINLSSITISNSVTAISDNAFYGCYGLTSIIIPNSVTSISNYAFYGCYGLTSIIIPNSVTNIGNYSFGECHGLTSLTIGSGVTSIGNMAFYHCTKLIDVYCYPVKVPLINNDKNIFVGVPISEVTLHVPKNSINAYQQDYPWNGFKEIVGIPNPQYLLTYMIDGCIYKQYHIEEGDSIKSEPYPTKEGYTFLGWSEIPTVMPDCDVTVIGSFAVNKYKLTYIVDETEYKSYDIEYCATITPEPAPTKEGYTFSGWSEIPETMPAHDITITGSFVINKYKLTYKVDDADYKSYELEYGAKITPEPAPTKEGYTFSGWSEIPATMPAHDVTVTGTFSVNKYKLTYMVNGEFYKTLNYNYGATITPEPSPTREGYTFSGWSEIPATMPAHDVTVTGTFAINKYKLVYKVDGVDYKTYELEYRAKITPEPAPTKEGYTFSGWSEIPATMPAHDVTVTGSFTKGAYKLTYIVGGEVYKTISYDYGATITPEPVPTKEGYTFSGWSEIPATMPAHDVTVTGSFAVNQYTITYIIDNEVYTTQTVNYGSTIIPPSTPEREGYDFAWGDYPETMPAYDITIYGTYTTGIEAIMAGEANCQIFSLDGKTLNEPQKGVNIVRMSNGQVRKVVVK